MEPMMTGAEVAELLRVSLATVYRLAARGELPAKKVGRVWRFQRDAVEEFTLHRLDPAGGKATRACERISANAKG